MPHIDNPLTVGILGFGRFGRVLYKILSPGYTIKVYDPNVSDIPNEIRCENLAEITQSSLLFLAVPIRNFETTIVKIATILGDHTTIIDVCSVKSFPAQVMESKLPKSAGIICSHPMFGPDSYSPYCELKMVMHPLRDLHHQYENLKSYFENHSIRIVELSPEAHDRLAAVSQGITHFIGRALERTGVRSTPINTLGFNDLLGVIEQTCNDSLELFKDLQRFNPYTDETIYRLEEAIRETHKLFNSTGESDGTEG
ncbi:MAG: prephenate dehydrogenase/arogenate dehydrogenase family protein [Candidatus Marinimicrobia bacterium]|nr:prephenate dehydrogenase/arogenate dehydrogenase family protein [Candidatus Neomarinimicrobiota bacterium]